MITLQNTAYYLARGVTLPLDFLCAGNVVVMTGIAYVVTMRAR